MASWTATGGFLAIFSASSMAVGSTDHAVHLVDHPDAFSFFGIDDIGGQKKS
jgi:hypothetical protein